MKTASVLQRFLSLLDVTLILLGILMLILMQAQLRTGIPPNPNPNPKDCLPEIANLDFVFLRAGWKGDERGNCYLLDENGKRGKNVSTFTASDIQEILAVRRAENEQQNQIVMLLFSSDGWYPEWDAERLAKIEQTWRVKLVPVYNVKFVQ